MAYSGQLGLQEMNSPMMMFLSDFHDTSMFIMYYISMQVIYKIVVILNQKFTDLKVCGHTRLEFLWTLTPIIQLLIFTVPSMKLLYLLDEIFDYDFSIKVIGRQWYWSYEYSDFFKKMFDSYMINNFKEKSLLRLLDVDNYMVVPVKSHIRLLISASDVIHSFTIPSMGIKVDAVPGRINQATLYAYRYGVFFGQCSEICGVNHSFMPIGVEVTGLKNFLNWVNN
uniref:Cytochrome c oxidase subunit 2 n=1 Tax=Ceratosolen solmsi TaxID=142686 RepID=I1SVE9_9HYME|nr:cytochrome c oxidase subunit II [Ceratosolen solmsi]